MSSYAVTVVMPALDQILLSAEHREWLSGAGEGSDFGAFRTTGRIRIRNSQTADEAGR